MGGSSDSRSSSDTTSTAQTPQIYGSDGTSTNQLSGIKNHEGTMNLSVTDGGAFDLAGQLVEGTVSASNAAREDALMFAGESMVEKREAIADAMNAGYTFAGEATNRAFDGMERSQQMGYQFAGEATEAGYDFAGEATNRSLDLIDSDREDTFAFLGEAFTSAMDANANNSDRLQELARQTSGNLMQNTEYAIDQVAEANESENLDTMRLIVLAGVATVGFIAWSANK